MPLVLVKETGAGLSNANSYADAADGDTYHLGHLYATSWTAATTANKEAALVMASRLIDSSYQFKGWRSNDGQALQWPRIYARDPDRLDSPFPVRLTPFGEYYDPDTVPKLIKDATCETARALIVADRTTDPDGEGLHQFALVGVLNVSFDADDRRPMIPHLALAMLSKLGQLVNEHVGTARLIRT
jgi:hypothetical protein